MKKILIVLASMLFAMSAYAYVSSSSSNASLSKNMCQMKVKNTVNYSTLVVTLANTHEVITIRSNQTRLIKYTCDKLPMFRLRARVFTAASSSNLAAAPEVFDIKYGLPENSSLKLSRATPAFTFPEDFVKSNAAECVKCGQGNGVVVCSSNKKCNCEACGTIR